MRSSIILAVTLAACNGPTTIPDAASDATPGCLSSGSGSITGSVMGAQVSPVRTAKLSTFASVPTIVLAETAAPDPCTAPMSSTGDYVNIYVCTAVAGTYPLAGFVPTCPSTSGGAVFAVQSGTGTTLSRAAGGMIAITSVDSTCMQATFSITFETGDMITGSLAAAVCP